MPQNFFYLLSRDRKRLRILHTWAGRAIPATRAPHPEALLPAADASAVTAIARADRLRWELWAETAEDDHDLVQRLVRRGYPLSPTALRVELRPRGGGRRQTRPN